MSGHLFCGGFVHCRCVLLLLRSIVAIKQAACLAAARASADTSVRLVCGCITSPCLNVLVRVCDIDLCLQAAKNAASAELMQRVNRQLALVGPGNPKQELPQLPGFARPPVLALVQRMPVADQKLLHGMASILDAQVLMQRMALAL